MFNPLEQPVLLLMAAVLPVLCAWVIKCVRGSVSAWLWVLGPVIAASAFGIDAAFSTDRELIREVIAEACEAVENESSEHLAPLVSTLYLDSCNQTRDILIRRFTVWTSTPLIERIIHRIAGLSITDGKAVMEMNVRAVFSKDSFVATQYKPIFFFRLTLKLADEGGRIWRITSADLKAIDGRPATWNSF